jgi:dipeptidyl-peptidase 9
MYKNRIMILHMSSERNHIEYKLILGDMICKLFQNGSLFPAELRMNSCGAKLNPQMCPSNPDLVAYVCNSDIWVSHTLTGNSEL